MREKTQMTHIDGLLTLLKEAMIDHRRAKVAKLRQKETGRFLALHRHLEVTTGALKSQPTSRSSLLNSATARSAPLRMTFEAHHPSLGPLEPVKMIMWKCYVSGGLER